MKRPAALQDEEQSKPLSAAYGRFFRAQVERIYPQATEAQWEALEKSAQDQLQAALAQEPVSRSQPVALYRLAVQIGVTMLRQARQQQADSEMIASDLSDAVLAHHQPLQEALARLPEPRRRAVGLRLSGLTMMEISDLLTWGETKTRQQVERGLRELQKALRKAGIEYEID